MKVTKYVNIDTEIEVDIRAEDFLASIQGESDILPIALQSLNRMAEVLKAIPDGIIEKMKPEQKNTVFNFLIGQCRRYTDEKELIVLGSLCNSEV